MRIFFDGTLEASSRRCASHLVEKAGEAIRDRGCFSLVLSGGSTPGSLYALLTKEPYRAAVDWRRTHVFWGDERCLPPDHTDSNYRLARESLLDHIPVPPEQVHPMPGDVEPEEGARQYEAIIRDFFCSRSRREPCCFDLILLGLGADGHTASLFPGDKVLEERQKLVVAVTPPPNVRPSVSRLTLTLPLFNKGRNICFLVSGRDKEQAVAAVLRGGTESKTLPGAMIRPTGDCYWFLSECGSRLAE